MAITYLVLSLDSGQPAHPGAIRDYLPVYDFDVELHHKGSGRFKFSVAAFRPRFDA
jgi:hypothetical protein